MSLLEQQNFLARLYTDEKLRSEFLSAPEKIGLENDLEKEEIADLIAVVPEELAFFSDSLVWKRLREVEKFLPLTKEFAGEEFAKLFKEFSENYNPQSVKKHLEDAFEFCAFLDENESVSLFLRDIARFEQAKLEFFGYGKRFVIRKFNVDLREISSKGVTAQSYFPKRKTFAVWLRIGNKTKFYTF